MTMYGYARVSTQEQNEGRQIIALREAGVPDKNIYLDKLSGKDFNRPMYLTMVSRLKPGDVVFLKSIDRLGRKYDNIIENWRMLTKEKGADIVVLDMPLLDTRIGKDLMGTFLSDVVLSLLSYVAENERAATHIRQYEGIVAAKSRGVHMGRPRKPLPPGFEKAYMLWSTRRKPGHMAAKMCKMPISTFYRKAGEILKNQLAWKDD